MPPPPPILRPPDHPIRVPTAGRIVALAAALASLAVLVTAVRLHPSPDGLGTHEELGLERCQFERRTGVPCPTCGMTTSFSHFVRGHWLASVYVQPFAAILALGTAMTWWGGIYIAATGRPIHRLLHLLSARYYLAGLLALAVVAWAWKIFIHLRGIDGWK